VAICPTRAAVQAPYGSRALAKAGAIRLHLATRWLHAMWSPSTLNAYGNP